LENIKSYFRPLFTYLSVLKLFEISALIFDYLLQKSIFLRLKKGVDIIYYLLYKFKCSRVARLGYAEGSINFRKELVVPSAHCRELYNGVLTKQSFFSTI